MQISNVYESVLILFATANRKSNGMFFCFRVFVSCAVALSFGHILRLPCKNFADFSVQEENSGLNSDALLRTLDNTNREECRSECLNNRRCKSFSTKESENSCELYSQSSEDPKDDVTVEDRPGWLYHSTYYADPLVSRIDSMPKHQTLKS